VSARRALVALATAAALAAPAAPADAALLHRCRAIAALPTAQHAFGATASGEFGCDGPRATLTVEVCLEVLWTNAWEPIACGTGEATDAASVYAEAYGCWWGLYLIRSTARGTSSDGEAGWAASPPVAYFCTPL
jgi:hypothetical protein